MAGRDLDYIQELLAAFGPVSIRRMFSGVGIYAEDAMFAMAIAGDIYLKADDHTIASFQQHGAAPFRTLAIVAWALDDVAAIARTVTAAARVRIGRALLG